jgi:hypothetical protein
MRQHTPDVRGQMSDVRTSTAALTSVCCSQRESYSYEHTRSVTEDRRPTTEDRNNIVPSRPRLLRIRHRPVQHPTSFALSRLLLRETTGASPAAKTLFTCPRTRGQRTDDKKPSAPLPDLNQN